MSRFGHVFVASALTLGACSSGESSGSPEILIGQCRSPRSISQPFQGRQLEQLLKVEVMNIPEGTDGVVFGWRAIPDGEFHDSIAAKPNFDMAVLKIGSGAVEFSVQNVGNDSEDLNNGVCSQQPDVVFSPASPEDEAVAVRPEW